MTVSEFRAANVSGLPPTTLTVDNNPAQNMIKLGGGRTVETITSRLGKLYLWEGDSAIYLEVEEKIGLAVKYRMVSITQDATAFATLVND